MTPVSQSKKEEVSYYKHTKEQMILHVEEGRSIMPQPQEMVMHIEEVVYTV